MRSIARRRAVVTSQAPGLAGVPSRGDREGFLRRFLGELEVAQEADQRSEDLTPLFSEGPFENR
jgi:hypothetical protein